MYAKRIKKGDTIGLISPSHVAKEENYNTIIAYLEWLGFKVKTGKNLFKSDNGSLISGRERADDLNDFILDQDVKMIFFGGGNGSFDLLPFINYENIKMYPKLFLSYSDGTSILNSITTKTGLVTYYGQTPGVFCPPNEYTWQQFMQHFLNEEIDNRFISNSNWHTLTSGVCEGILTGGYVDNFVKALDSPYYVYDKSSKYILFLEDHVKFHNVSYVSSMLSNLEQNKFINHVGGLLFGNYSDPISNELLERLKRLGQDHNVPVAYCDDFGHGNNHAILPVGRNAKLDTCNKSLIFE